MAAILETNRLVLREFETRDAGFIIELLNTESWIKYIGDRKVRTTEAALAYLQNGPVLSYQRNGFGMWMVELKEHKTPVGMCGLIRRDTLDHPDIGFAFLPEYEGKGFAFESAKAALDFGFQKAGLQEIIAITVPENERSIALLKKLGLSLAKEITWEETGEPLLKFSIKSRAFLI